MSTAVPPTATLARIDHVQLPVPDLREAADWYEEHLGFCIEYRNEDFVILRLAEGPALFLWRTADETTANFTRAGEPWPALGIEAADVRGLRERLLEAGARVTLFEDDGLMTVLKFADPYGNLIAALQPNQRS